MRSSIRYYGGKGLMVRKLIPLVPVGGRPYCEPYCGGASLFFARDPAPCEVLNDLNQDIIGLYRVLQDPATFAALKHRLEHTLYSLAEFVRALETLARADATPIDRAWAVFVRQNQGFSAIQAVVTGGHWSRSFGVAKSSRSWVGKIDLLDAFHDRLRRVQIDCRDALECIRYWDTPETVFYLDPPYHFDTRSSERKIYSVESDAEHHAALIETILACAGAVVLSGYDHADYRPLDDAGWSRTEFRVACHAAGKARGSKMRGAGSALKHAPRMEVVWRNPRCAELQHGSGALY